MDLQGKKILFIAPKLFGIPEKIQKKLQDEGAEVEYYDERPGNTFLIKALIRINRNIIGFFINNYHRKIIEKTQNKKYDYIFFIKGESFSESNLSTLFKNHLESRTIVYHWDSIANNKNALNLLQHFDICYSFDKEDCKNFSIKFLPLFYYDEYSKLSKSVGKEKYDLLFVGTVHSDRYRIVKTMINQVKEKGGRAFSFFYFQGKIMFYKYILQHKECRDIDRKSVNFTPISETDLIELYQNSKAVVDINHPKQTGLTLRCIETLGANRKLLTTNQDICTYDFYNPNNIFIIDRNNPIIPENFLKVPYEEPPKEIYTKYSLSSWLKQIFR